MLKKLQWFGDPWNLLQSRTRDLSENQAPNPSIVSQHRKIPSRSLVSNPKKKLCRGFFRRGSKKSKCPSSSDKVSGSAGAPSPDSRSSCVLSFKGWFLGLCICGRRRRSCNETFAAWRSFRKDWTGSVPVAVETLEDFLPEQPPLYPSLDDSLSSQPYDYQLEKTCMTNDVVERLYDPRVGSLETGGIQDDFNGIRGNPWCKILYWEGRERKGSEFPVADPSINVMGDTPHGSGLSLAALFGGAHHDERIMRTRKKICQGLVLWREGEVVWVYNRSEAPVYLNSASLDGSFYHLNLYKCPPGYAMIIYYYEMARHLMGLPEYKNRCMDKADVNSVRISFAKGWGKNYQRREILCCPCWIEVHVVPTLRVEQLTPPR